MREDFISRLLIDTDKIIKQCPTCGVEFEPVRQNQKYCGERCRRDAHPYQRTGIMGKEVACRFCGATYIAKTSNNFYCSEKCRAKERLLKKRKKRYADNIFVCKTCGKEYTADENNTAFFCSPECKELRNGKCVRCGKPLEGTATLYCSRECYMATTAEKKAKPKSKKPKVESLARVAKKAAKMGMSYGEYMVWQTQQNQCI